MNRKVIFLSILLIGLVIAMLVVFSLANKSVSAKVPLPCYFSVRYNVANVRTGPGEEYPIVWIYKLKGVPVKAVAKYKDWYQVEDFSGKNGWIASKNLSSYKTARTLEKVNLYRNPTDKSPVVASIDAGLILHILFFKDEYVKVVLLANKVKLSGWALRSKLWGAVIKP